MKVNISQVNLYQTCPTKWYDRYVLRREKAGSNDTLDAGTIFHKAMEVYFYGVKEYKDHVIAKGMAEEYLTMQAESISDRPKLKATLFDLATKFQFMPHPAYYDPASVIGVEKTIEMPLGRHTLIGRLDGIVLDSVSGLVWHVQNRTLGLSTKMDTYIESRIMDPHELAYGALLAHEYRDRKIGGTITNFVKKGGTPSSEKWYEEVIPWSQNRWHDMEEDYGRLIDEMQELTDPANLRYGKPIKNRTACRTVWGSMCPYWDVCAHEQSLYSSPYTDVPDEYFMELFNDAQ